LAAVRLGRSHAPTIEPMAAVAWALLVRITGGCMKLPKGCGCPPKPRPQRVPDGP